MAKDPAFLFYASDFLTGTMFFTNEQAGKYIRLLCSQHQHGGFIEKNAFNSIAGEDNLLKSKFIETEHGFYNVRLADEMEKRNKKSGNISEAAKETWKKRKESNTIVKESYYDSNTKPLKTDTIVIRTENENEDINKDKGENEKKIENSKNPDYQKCMDIYFEFIKNKNGVVPKINGAEGKSLKELIIYFQSIVIDKTDPEAVPKAFQYLFSHWQKIEPWLQGRLKLTQINSEITNILSQIKNGKPTGKPTHHEKLAASIREAGADPADFPQYFTK